MLSPRACSTERMWSLAVQAAGVTRGRNGFHKANKVFIVLTKCQNGRSEGRQTSSADGGLKGRWWKACRVGRRPPRAPHWWHFWRRSKVDAFDTLYIGCENRWSSENNIWACSSIAESWQRKRLCLKFPQAETSHIPIDVNGVVWLCYCCTICYVFHSKNMRFSIKMHFFD